MQESTSVDRPPWLALALAGLACLAYLATELYLLGGGLGFPLDDSWIHLQFARQLAAGAGLSYNPGGPWVPGSTSPLWTALLALGFPLPGGAVLWAKLFGCLCFLATVHATDRFAAALGLGAGGRRLAAVLVAATPWLAWSALSGMEVGLFAWLSLSGLTLHLRERADPARLPLSLPVLALACLARPEGYLLLALAAGDRLLFVDRSLRSWRDGVLPAAVLLLPTLAFYYLTSGSFLPTTFAVKSAPPTDLLPSGRYLRTVLDVLFRSQPVMLLAAGAGAARLVEGLGDGRRRGLLPALWPLALALVNALMAAETGPVLVGNFGRYYFPLLPVVVVLGVLGVAPAAAQLGRRARAVAVTLILAPQLWGLAHGPLAYARSVTNVEDSDVAAARWLAPRLPAAAVLAVQDVGALKYLLPNRVVDLTGIVNPELVPVLHGRPGDPVYWELRLLAWLEERRPDYLVVFPRSYPTLTGQLPGFAEVRSFTVADNVTMAGDRLAIFSTPWTRHPLAEGADEDAPAARDAVGHR